MRSIGQLFVIACLIGLGLLLLVTAYGVFQQQEFAIGAGVLCAALASLYLAYRIVIEDVKEKQFITWLVEHKNSIGQRTIEFDGAPIMPNTVLARYFLVVSLGIVSFKMPSRHFVKEHHCTAWHALVFSFFTILVGWWGIPFGPIYTVQALFKNLTGGQKTVVSNLIVEMNQEKDGVEQDGCTVPTGARGRTPVVP